jgi:hypothetical protein
MVGKKLNFKKPFEKPLLEPCVSCAHKNVCEFKRVVMHRLSEPIYMCSDNLAIVFTATCKYHMEIQASSNELENGGTEEVTDNVEEPLIDEKTEDISDQLDEPKSGEENEIGVEEMDDIKKD